MKTDLNFNSLKVRSKVRFVYLFNCIKPKIIPAIVKNTEPKATNTNDLKTNTAITSKMILQISITNTFRKLTSGRLNDINEIPENRSNGKKKI